MCLVEEMVLCLVGVQVFRGVARVAGVADVSRSGSSQTSRQDSVTPSIDVSTTTASFNYSYIAGH